MTLKKVGTYGQMFGGMPLGFGEENWWTKIGQDYMQDVPDNQPAILPPAPGPGDPYYSGPNGGAPSSQSIWGKASTLYGNDLRNYWQTDPYAKKEYQWTDDNAYLSTLYGKGTGDRLNEQGLATKHGLQWVTPTSGEPWKQPPPPPGDPPIDPNTLTGNELRNYWIGKNQWTDDNTYITQKLAEWNNNSANMPTTPEGMAAKLGLTWTPAELPPTPPGEDVPYVLTPFGGRTAYQSSYDPNLEAQQNKLALENARLGALPGLQEALAGAGERANLAAGEGGKSGMAYEFQRKPLEKFGQQMAQTAGQLEIGSLQTQKEEKKAKAMWDMEQDVKEHDWMRGETSKLFGGQYAQDLNDKEWERNNAADVAKSNIEIAFKNGEINRDEAWKRWSATNDERLRKLSEQRADLEWQRSVAQQNSMFDKQAQLTREMKAIDKEIAQAQASAQEDAGMWGGIGALAGGIGGAILMKTKAMICFADSTEVLVSKRISDLQEGDIVIGKQPNGKLIKNKVTKLLKYENANLKQRVNDNLELTDHPFITDKWEAKLVSEIDEPTIGLNNSIAIKVEKIDRKGTVYNLELDGNFTYFVKNGDDYSLVHNGRAVI